MNRRTRLVLRSSLSVASWLILFLAGCGQVAGNYPAGRTSRIEGPQCASEGFRVTAGSRIDLERIQADLGRLRRQGFSGFDPQIQASVARRERIPPAILLDRSGVSYHRLRVTLAPEVSVDFQPGALRLHIACGDSVHWTVDEGLLVNDSSSPGGCRDGRIQPVTVESRCNGQRVQHRQSLLLRVRAPGRIVALELDPDRIVVRRTH